MSEKQNLHIALPGAAGKMGQMIASLVTEAGDIDILQQVNIPKARLLERPLVQSLSARMQRFWALVQAVSLLIFPARSHYETY